MDGLFLPSQALGSIFSANLHPIKTVNNGSSYVLGFIIGCIMLILLNVLYIWIIINDISTEREKAENEEKARIEKIKTRNEEKAKRRWEKKWAAMSLDQKLNYITKPYVETQQNNVEKLRLLGNIYSETAMKFGGKEPDLALSEIGIKAEASGFFKNLLSAGESDLEIARKRYNQLAGIYKYYETRYKILLQTVLCFNAEYNLMREKAVLYLQLIKEFIAELPIKKRELFDNLEGEKIDQVLLDNKSLIKDVLNSIGQLDANYRIQAEESFGKSMELAGKNFSKAGKILEKSLSKGKFSDKDISKIGNKVLDGAVVLGAEAIGQYMGNLEKSKEAKTQLAEGELELRKGIEGIEADKQKLVGLSKRFVELNYSLEKSMEYHIAVFNDVYSYIFTAGDESKTKEVRKRREEEGGDYYSDDEFERIMGLREFSKLLGTLVDSSL